MSDDDGVNYSSYLSIDWGPLPQNQPQPTPPPAPAPEPKPDGQE
jgi:hypothetical protein